MAKSSDREPGLGQQGSLPDDAPAAPPAVDAAPDSQQAAWEAELAAPGFTYIDEQLRDRAYVDAEFPSSVELDETTELVPWSIPRGKRLTMDEVRAAMITDGITPATPQHGPKYAPEQPDGTTIWIPQLSESADALGYRRVVDLNRDGECCEFDRHWRHPSYQWSGGDQFLGARTKSSNA